MAEVSAIRGVLSHESAPLDDPHLVEFTDELTRQSEQPPSNDRVIGAMCLAAITEFQTNPLFRHTVADLVSVRASETPSQQVGDFRAVTQTELLADNPDFPRRADYTDPASWREPLRMLADRYVAVDFDSITAEEQSERLATNLLFRKVQTNVPERALPVEYVMQSRRIRFAEGVRWLDIGCGIMEGQSLLHNKKRYGFPQVSVVDAVERPDHQATERLNSLLDQDSMLESSIGMDLTDAYDPNTFLWSRGSLRPAELANESFMERFTALAEERLTARNPGNPATFIVGDILSDKDVAELQDLAGSQKFEIVSILTMAHQLEPHQRPELLKRATQLTTDNGIVVLSDFTRLRSKHRTTPKHLSFYKHWHLPYRYRSFIWDMAEPEQGLQEILRARTSRCDAFQVTDKAFYID